MGSGSPVPPLDPRVNTTKHHIQESQEVSHRFERRCVHLIRKINATKTNGLDTIFQSRSTGPLLRLLYFAILKKNQIFIIHGLCFTIHALTFSCHFVSLNHINV